MFFRQANSVTMVLHETVAGKRIENSNMQLEVMKNVYVEVEM